MIDKIQNNGDTPLYNISTAARMLNISVHTLRLYEKEGLILPYKKSTNHRLYSQHDIERIECVREAIKEKKFTIPAIKSIYSLIPCWKIINCSETDRANCQAFPESRQPCWAYGHKSNICEKIECRTCEIYQNFNKCEKIKQEIIKITS
jgi:MerR family transcriptional regulator, heat shock protein HspR